MRFGKTITGLKSDLKRIANTKKRNWKSYNLERFIKHLKNLMSELEEQIETDLARINHMIHSKIPILSEEEAKKVDKALARYSQLLKIYREALTLADFLEIKKEREGNEQKQV